MKKLVASLLAVTGFTTFGNAITSPTSASFKVYEMRVSRNTDCTNSISIFKTANPTAQDVFTTPSFGSGAIPVGTYHCIMFQVSDQVTIDSAGDAPGCPAGSQVLDFFQTGPVLSATPPPGFDISPTASEDRPWIFFNDSSQAVSVASGGNCYQPNENCACGAMPCPLPADAVTSDQTLTLVVDFTGREDGSSGGCNLGEPFFSLR